MEELEPIVHVRRQTPEPGAQFKTFYTKIVRAAMRYAVQHAPFSTAQEVTQRTAYKCWTARLAGVDAAELMIRDGASALRASLREGIVRSWRRERPKVDAPSSLSAATLDGLPLDPQIAATIGYFMHTMSAEEEAAFEHRLALEAEFFEKVSPVAMALVWPGAVRGPGGGDEWKPRRAPRGVQAWQDYRMPARGVELMWRWFCEVVGRSSFR